MFQRSAESGRRSSKRSRWRAPRNGSKPHSLFCEPRRSDLLRRLESTFIKGSCGIRAVSNCYKDNCSKRLLIGNLHYVTSC